MTKPTVELKVVVELDLVPGWGNSGEDYRKHVQQVLDGTIGHYHPVVSIVRETKADFGSYIRELRESLETIHDPYDHTHGPDAARLECE
jgi:hypothetical protein